MLWIAYYASARAQGNAPSPKAWFSYIVIHRRCLCGLIVGGQRWIKSFVFLKYITIYRNSSVIIGEYIAIYRNSSVIYCLGSLKEKMSPSAIPDNRSPMNCDIWKPGLTNVCSPLQNQLWSVLVWSIWLGNWSPSLNHFKSYRISSYTSVAWPEFAPSLERRLNSNLTLINIEKSCWVTR